MNSTLLSMLRSLTQAEKKCWNKHLARMMFNYNNSVCDATGYTPYTLLFGREPRLPIDWVLRKHIPEEVSSVPYNQYLEEYTSSMNRTHELAQSVSVKQNEKNAQRAALRKQAVKLTTGDKVLVKNKRETGGPGKLRDHFESEVYVIIKVFMDDAVFTVKGLEGGEERNLHRSMIHPCNDMELPKSSAVVTTDPTLQSLMTPPDSMELDDDIDEQFQDYCDFYGKFYETITRPNPVTKVNLKVPIILSSRATSSASSRSLDESREGGRPESSNSSDMNITPRYEGPDPNPSDFGGGPSFVDSLNNWSQIRTRSVTAKSKNAYKAKDLEGCENQILSEPRVRKPTKHMSVRTLGGPPILRGEGGSYDSQRKSSDPPPAKISQLMVEPTDNDQEVKVSALLPRSWWQRFFSS